MSQKTYAEVLLDNRIGCVYAFASPAFPDHVKIGFTTNLSGRLSNANTWAALSPFRVLCTLPNATKEDEAKAHRHFRKQRRRGEFFQITHAEVARYFEREAASKQVVFNKAKNN